MKSPKRPVPRKQSKQKEVVGRIREAILNGSYPAGSRLPNQIELAQQLQVSGFTLHRALDQLASDGFIEKRPKVGTRVAGDLPHRNNIALVFPHDPSAGAYYSKHFQTLSQAATAWQRETGRNVITFFGMDQRTDSKDRNRLLEDVAAHRLAGIVFSSPPFELENSAILEEPGIPRVCISNGPYSADVPAVGYDGLSFFDTALSSLAAQGRKRVVCLLVPGMAGIESYLFRAAARLGITSPPHWQLTLAPDAGEGARNVVRLLMHGPASERPDGLIISDDNLVEHAQAGLIASGVNVPDDVMVIEHCNFPWPRSALSTCRLGFNSHDIFRACVDVIDRQRRGEEVPGLTLISAVFEEDLPAKRKSEATSEKAFRLNRPV